MRLTELADLAIPAGTRLSPATVGTYRRAFDHFIGFLADEEDLACGDVRKLTVDHFIRFAASLASGEYEYAARSRTVYNSGVKHLMNAAILGGHMALTPADDLRYKMAVKEYGGKVKQAIKLPKREWVDWTVEGAIQSAAKRPGDVRLARDAAILCFLRATGCRAAELTTLVFSDVETKECAATVVGKGSKSRTVFFDDTTTQALYRYWDVRGESHSFEYVFTVGRIDKPITTATVRRAVEQARATAGVTGHPDLLGKHLTPHQFRHSFATEMLERTGNLAAVQDLLGHSSPNTTRVYAKLSMGALKSVYDQAAGKRI